MGNSQSSTLEGVAMKTEQFEDGGCVPSSAAGTAAAAATGASAPSSTSNNLNAVPSIGDDAKENDERSSKMIIIDCGHCKGALEAKLSTTVAELYKLVVEEFDDEMIPGGGTLVVGGDTSTNDNDNGIAKNSNANASFSFFIWIQGVQPTKKQATRVTVSDIIQNNWTVQLIEKVNAPSRRPSPTATTTATAAAATTATTTNAATTNGNGKRLRDEREKKMKENENGTSRQLQKPTQHEERVHVPPVTGTKISAAALSSLSSTSYSTAAESLLHKNPYDSSDPSPLKRSRIFSNPDTAEATNHTNQTNDDSTNSSSLIVTPNLEPKRPSASAEEPQQQEQQRQISENGHHNNDRAQERNKEQSTNASSLATVGKSSFETDETQQQSNASFRPSERRTNNAHIEDNGDQSNDTGMIDCDFGADADANIGDESDGDTVVLSLSPTSENNSDESGSGRLVVSNENQGNDHDGDYDIDVDIPQGDELPVPVVVAKKDDPHAKCDSALEKSCQTLMGIEKMLFDNKTNSEGISFCSEARNDEWREEVEDQLSSGTIGPKTIVGVLGSTGVGKSSLLNALLDEAAVLPTSGSRGCTAAVVELTYNRDLVQDAAQTASAATASVSSAAKKIPVYKGKVEFIKLEDWRAELKLLVDECSTQEKSIYSRCPEEDNQPDAAAAWAKIDQVYGKGTMANFSGRSTTSVFQRLSTNTRVVNLLTPDANSQDPYNAVYIEEGLIDLPDAAGTVLCEYQKMGLRTRRNLKRWAKSFRSKINDYVYRKGNGNDAQTWPLIRCVMLQGPWNVLSSGGVLVDLPGVRDANAARARVSERYLQNCNQIWVVAPIKRAVDDGTAKELMGEQFKRRLLMDGQYGNIAFICTQTDDCEATEIMRDHEDVAVRVPGRWQEMSSLRDKINDIEIKCSDLQQQEEDLKFADDEAKELLKEISSDLQNATTPREEKTDSEIDDDDEAFVLDDDAEEIDVSTVKNVDENTIQELLQQLSNQTKTVGKTTQALLLWRDAHTHKIHRLTSNCSKLQRRLKGICAKVRNEYSTKCLQEDFITGLKEIYRDEQELSEGGENNVAIRDDISLPVFCISANDYLKLTGIKPSSDGPANCFSFPADTQIHRLREFVHSTTASRQVSFTKAFVNRTSDLLDRVKLLVNDSRASSCDTRQKVQCQDFFLNEMESLSKELNTTAVDFREKAVQKVMHTLKPSLSIGARKANSAAMSTVDSWGSKSRRTRNDRSVERNGLYWSTYFATARRDGVYVSASAGSVDLNAELMEPMEAEFTPAWQSIMDGAVRNLISESERKVIDVCKQLDQVLLNGFFSIGIDKARISSMVSISSSNCRNALRTSFSTMRDIATENQRELSRSLLPKVKQSMHESYEATINVHSGVGKFSRMKGTMQSKSSVAIKKVFNECMNELLVGIEHMVQNLSTRIDLVKETISKSLASVYSILWEDQNIGMAIDPVHQQKVLACRVALMPLLNQLREEQDKVMEVLGIERPILDLEIAAVETWEQKNAKNMQMAKENGGFVELQDDSEDEEIGLTDKIGAAAVKEESKPEYAVANLVKTEVQSSKSYVLRSILNETISLLDSDDDSDYDDDSYINHDIRCVVARAGGLGISVKKVLEGFFVWSIESNSQLMGKIFLGDILKSIDGKRLNKLSHEQNFNYLKESADKQKRRIYVLRSKVAVKAKAGPLGLSLSKVQEGFLVSDVNEDSQLLGKVFQDDILTSIDGTRFSELNDENVSIEVKKTSYKTQRRICIIRKRK